MKKEFKYQISCKRCGLRIESNSESQFNYNLKEHLAGHKRKGEMENQRKVKKVLLIKRGKEV